ncbi:MAG: hypothetical protein J6C15_09155 [Bacteroidaceae bacterium]|nr:hypothetical protein [Bacteroidaceae bacterium]
MKKDYLRPEVEIIDIITSTLMSTSPGNTEIPGGNTGGEILSNEHRGEWGNIWGDME